MRDILAMKRELSHLAQVLAKAPDDLETLKKKSALTDRLIGLMVEEMLDLSRDVDAAKSAAARNRLR